MRIDIPEIEKFYHIVPHFIDRSYYWIRTYEICSRYKNISINEDQFRGHFPGHPIMPGVLILEAMAQVGGFALLYPAENRGKLAYFGGMDNVKFKKPVVPGDQLIMKSEIVKIRGDFGKVHCEGFVDDKLVAQGDFTFALQKPENL